MLGPNSPLGQQIQRLLKEHPEGLTPEDIEIRLRQQGFQASTATIKKVLSHTDVFFPLSGGRYALRSIIEATGDVELVLYFCSSDCWFLSTPSVGAGGYAYCGLGKYLL